jgi:hypothetical protein
VYVVSGARESKNVLAMMDAREKLKKCPKGFENL